ncbi:MAG: hypothetical protein PWQ82_1697 [Thermosediminibacterales bacterium]|nr:hypothetical protein [Thermosediminibacterales bacterium]MDK2836660.1 hypothetical protein [Thermosediminibacterales bacterium]
MKKMLFRLRRCNKLIGFLTDENISPKTVSFLRSYGLDIKDIKEEGLSGIKDKQVLNLARSEDRIIITCDLDFSNILRFPLNQHSGILVIRAYPPTVENINSILKKFLQEIDDLKTIHHKLTIVEKDKFRICK